MTTNLRSVALVIDPLSYTPVYRQLADLLRSQIEDGTLAPGALLPAEPRMASEHGVGRDTVRQALTVLRAEGLVITRPREGTYVRAEPVLAEFSAQRGSRVRFRMPTPSERLAHGIDEGVPVAIVRHGHRTVLLVGDRTELVVK